MIEKLIYVYEEPNYEEVFKPIIYPDIDPEKYFISNYGRVKIKYGKIMKTYFDKDDHEKITLVTTYKNISRLRRHKPKHFFIHRLMIYSFLGNPPDDIHCVVNHKNGIPCCNFIHNLEWVSALENTNHAK